MANIFKLSLAFFIFNIINIHAQNDIKITGTVMDKDVNQPLEYATIAFFSKKENKVVTGGITLSRLRSPHRGSRLGLYSRIIKCI